MLADLVPAEPVLARLRRALVPVVALLLAGGALGAWRHEPASTPDAGGSAVAPANAETGSGSGDQPNQADGGGAVPGVPAPPPGQPPASVPPDAALGALSVPAPGRYVYEVETFRDGTSTTRTEAREISVDGGGEGSAVVHIVVSTDGEVQTSVLEWSAERAVVRSTRVDPDGQPGRDCSWDPPFVEFGTLSDGNEWDVQSTCQTDVAGLPSVFTISGIGRVLGLTEIDHAGERVVVWEIERDRTTVITATVGEESLEQRAREQGRLFVDPTRGLVLRADMTLTLSGTQEGVTRRVSVLRP